MPDDTQEVNCVLGVCCGKDGKQHKALTDQIVRETKVSPADARKVAAWMLTKYDFAEKGTLKPLIDSIAKLARGNDYE